MSLIGLMSVGVISLVVWLVLVFLSVTSGIEKNWLKKLTAISAPLTITPTEAYYASYYYQVDGISSQSNYTYKSIGEKAKALLTDPYLPQWDQAIPKEWPEKVRSEDGSTKDLVKETLAVLNTLNLEAQDYETSGAILNVEMLRTRSPFFSNAHSKNQCHLIQLFYLSTFNGRNPALSSLIEPPRINDLNHLFFSLDLLVKKVEEDLEVGVLPFRNGLQRLLPYVAIETMQTISPRWHGVKHLIPEGIELDADPLYIEGRLVQVSIPLEKKRELIGKVFKKEGHLFFVEKKGGASQIIDERVPLFLDNRLEIRVTPCPPLIDHVNTLKDLYFIAKADLQGFHLEGRLPWEGLEIQKATVKTHFNADPNPSPLWPYFVKGRGYLPKGNFYPVILPKCLQKNGALIGDMGRVCFGGGISHSMQEHSVPITICGFYDPGVMPIGGKIALTDPELPHIINQAYETLTDPSMKNGIQVYLSDLKQAKKVKETIEASFEEKGLAPYWDVTTFEEYEFSKDLLQQFQSDKYLLTLIAMIVLIVACSNIISFLILLVNDKRKEIAILSAMGASKKRIALIFTLCGGIVGTLSTFIGTLCAALTLHYIDLVVDVLSFFQGHDTFNALFYDTSLPNKLSQEALIFILIATPTISLLAGLIPALKAAKVHPSAILRAE